MSNNNEFNIEEGDDNNYEDVSIAVMIDSETGESIHNNWTKENMNTANIWKTSTEYDTYIYKKILHKYQKKLNRTFVLITVISLISSILGAISSALSGSVFFGVDDPTIQYILFCTSILITIAGLVITAVTNVIKYFKWDDKVTQISKYITNLDNFNTTVSSQLILPDKARLNAMEFLKKENANYSNLKKNDPDISLKEYQDAGRGYEKYLKRNNDVFLATQQYSDNIAFNMV